MPPICLHLSLAKEAAAILKHPIVEESLGSYLLGSTAPDIRIITGSSREALHFYDLTNEQCGSGVEQLFQANAALADLRRLTESTAAFVCGYIAHLVTDETWIRQIYRPFFGKNSAHGGSSESNLLDRALQFELDRRERLNKENMAAIAAVIKETKISVTLPFIESLDLVRWRDFVYTATNRPPIWDTFALFAGRYFTGGADMEKAQVERWINSTREKLETVITEITPKRLAGFRDKSITSSVVTVRKYLSGEFDH